VLEQLHIIKEALMRLILGLALLLCIEVQVARADSQEPILYFFWTRDCGYCDQAQSFLDRARAEDPAIQVRDFEVEYSLANAIVLSRLYERIGMAGLAAVPLIVVGTYVYIGFDEKTAPDVLEGIKECRKKACHDIVHDLIRPPRDVDQASAYFIPPPLCTAKRAAVLWSK
jgi:hypothetical protein